MAGKPLSNSERLIQFIEPLLASLGYELVHLEAQTGRANILRLFIDIADGSRPVGVEDCAKVSRALDEPLEQSEAVNQVFNGSYELEVSSPGVDRPLRLPKDYEKFSGREARIHVFRPLTAEELENAEYQKLNPKQKNFIGVIGGISTGQKVLISISKSQVCIPLTLISKANLEPKFAHFEQEQA